MRRALLFGLALAAATPAHATAGMFCETTGPNPLELALVITRAVGGPLVSATLLDNGIEVPNTIAQWWLDGSEMRLILIDPNAERVELELRARRRGDYYAGRATRGSVVRPVRCEESG